MNADMLLKHFDRISEAPDAVARLRRFILELAVRGKLVEPTGSVELVALASLCTSTSGNGKMIKGTLSAEFGEGLYPCFSASGQDVWHDTFEHEGEAVIVSAVGARCGKAFLAAGKWSAIANTHILFPKQDVCSLAYLYLIANNESLWVRGGSAQPFVKVAATLKERFVYFPPLAEQHRIVAKVDELMALCDQLEAARSKRESRRDRLVAASLHCIGTAPVPFDGAATEAQSSPTLRDAARFHLDHLPHLATRPEHIKQLRQTILDLAVHGRLVPQDPQNEPATELLKRIQAKKDHLINEGTIKKHKPFAPLTGVDIPFLIPEGWTWVRLSDIADVQDPNPSHRMPHYVLSGGAPFISSENFVGSDQIDFRIGKQVSKQTLDEQIARFPILEGALAFTRIGTIGKSRFLPSERTYAISHAVCVINPLDKASINMQFLRSTLGADSILASAHKGTRSIGVPDLGMAVIRAMAIPFPPLVEQLRIVARVDELMALCDQLETHLAKSEADSRRLLEAVLNGALAPSLEKAA